MGGAPATRIFAAHHMTTPPNVLTIDLEDWFNSLEPEPSLWGGFPRRAEAATDLLLAVMAEENARATFFVLGDVARHSPRLLERILAGGHEMATHGMEHRFVYRQTPGEFAADLAESIRLISSISGVRVNAYRAPYFSITAKSLWALDVLRDHGITFDSSIFPVHHHHYGIPGAPRLPFQVRPGLWEWPISTFPTPVGNLPFSGGAYFRLLPESLVRGAYRALRRRGEPVLFYLHPWEVDPGQPRFSARSAFLNFRHYHGLGSTLHRLRRLLREAAWIPLGEGWNALGREHYETNLDAPEQMLAY
jgi:polysaccharide deacetylase family protein (PEP-CTERM system associated)